MGKNAEIIKGKFDLPKKKNDKKSAKKKLREEFNKMVKERDKKIRMQCQCNHIDRKHGKVRLKDDGDGKKVCEICGATIISDPSMISEEILQASVDSIYTIMSLVRNKIKLTDEADKDITTQLYLNARVCELYKSLVEMSSEDGELKFNKNKKKKKNKKN